MGILKYFYIALPNLNSVTYWGLNHTHLMMACVRVTNNQIIQKHQTESFLILHPTISMR